MNPPSDSLAGKVALVTGAASGLGEASLRLLAACGARVAALDRDAGELARVHADVTAAGGEVLAITVDVTDAAGLAEAVAEVERTWGRLDIVLANAGLNGVWAPVDEITPEEWDETLGINLKGTFLTVRAAVPLMKRGGGGSVIITSSGVGSRMFGSCGASAYAASKAGQVAFGRMIALELAKDKIRVNTLCPGAFKTNIVKRDRFRNHRELRLPVKFPEGTVPLTGGHSGDPADYARVVWFLASEFSGHITGTEIYVDGAQSLLMG